MPLHDRSSPEIDPDVLWRLFPADRPPAVPSPYDDEFDAAALDAKWAWRNQSTSTWVQDGSGLGVIAIPSSAGQNLRILEQVAPAGNFTMIAKFSTMEAIDSTMYYGLCVANSSSGKVYSFSLATFGGSSVRQIRGGKWTTATSFSAGNYDYTISSGPTFYEKVSWDGTNFTWDISAEGKAWSRIASDNLAPGFLTTFDRIGFHLESENGKLPVAMAVHFFRVTTP